MGCGRSRAHGILTSRTIAFVICAATALARDHEPT